MVSSDARLADEGRRGVLTHDNLTDGPRGASVVVHEGITLRAGGLGARSLGGWEGNGKAKLCAKTVKRERVSRGDIVRLGDVGAMTCGRVGHLLVLQQEERREREKGWGRGPRPNQVAPPTMTPCVRRW